jgi:hypothetical protein
MITFTKKTDPQSLSKGVEDNRFEQIRKAAADKRVKSDTEATRRRDRQKADDDRLL